MDWYHIDKLAEEIVQTATAGGVWTKWSADREQIAERAVGIWIPVDDLRAALNALPGPTLSEVDVAQRLRDLREQPYTYQDPVAPLEADALAAYAEEKAKGTEFIALLGYMEEWYWGAEERLRCPRSAPGSQDMGGRSRSRWPKSQCRVLCSRKFLLPSRHSDRCRRFNAEGRRYRWTKKVVIRRLASRSGLAALPRPNVRALAHDTSPLAETVRL